MSINLEIIARGRLINEATKQAVEYKDSFPVIQVPTKETFHIIESKEPMSSYKEYVKNEHGGNDWFTHEHLDKLAEWEQTMKGLGLTITFSYD